MFPPCTLASPRPHLRFDRVTDATAIEKLQECLRAATYMRKLLIQDIKPRSAPSLHVFAGNFSGSCYLQGHSHQEIVRECNRTHEHFGRVDQLGPAPARDRSFGRCESFLSSTSVILTMGTRSIFASTTFKLLPTRHLTFVTSSRREIGTWKVSPHST